MWYADSYHCPKTFDALSKSVITIYPTPGAYGHFTP